MSLKAQVRTDSLGNITVYIDGSLDFENCLPFRQELLTLRDKNPYAMMTLDLGGLDFVGSSGISHLVETVRLLQHTKSTLQLSNVKAEFLKVFKLYELEVTIHVSEEVQTTATARQKKNKENLEA